MIALRRVIPAKLAKFVVVVFVGGMCSVVAIAGFCTWANGQYQANFRQVRVGMSEPTVRGLLGEPDRIRSEVTGDLATYGSVPCQESTRQLIYRMPFALMPDFDMICIGSDGNVVGIYRT